MAGQRSVEQMGFRHIWASDDGLEKFQRAFGQAALLRSHRNQDEAIMLNTLRTL